MTKLVRFDDQLFKQARFKQATAIEMGFTDGMDEVFGRLEALQIAE
jgi:hypothetical protein